MHFIDVGQGGGVFIQKDGKNILYDRGDVFVDPTLIRENDEGVNVTEEYGVETLIDLLRPVALPGKLSSSDRSRL